MSDKPISPPPPVIPVPDVETAHASMSEMTDVLEATIERASSFSEEDRNRRVNDEWSTIESLRHITFVIDVWLGKAIKGEQDPFHTIGLPPHFMPAKFPGSSIDPDATPTFDEACDVMRGRLDTLRGFVATLTPEELERPIENHARTVGGGLNVIFSELQAHDHFINRDLDIIQASLT